MDFLHEEIVKAMNDADGDRKVAVDLLHARLNALAKNGNDAAIDLLRRAEIAGCRGYIDSFAFGKEGRLYKIARGRKVSVRAAKSVHRRDQATGKARQLVLPMIGMLFSDLQNKLLEMGLQRTRLANSIQTIHRLLELQTKAPDAKTPKEALETIGVTAEAWLAG